jgi:hypothetical protein
VTVNASPSLSETEYAELVARVQMEVARAVPPGASVLVISKGDSALLDIPGLRTAHFPQDPAGGYAGHYPADSAAAIAAIEDLRRRGAEYLVIPSTAEWWLDYYEGFARHLASHLELVSDRPDACLVYGLGHPSAVVARVPATTRPQASIDQIRDFLEKLISTDTSLIVLEAVDGLAAGLAPLNAMRLAAGETEGDADEPILEDLQRLAAGGAEYLVVPRSTDEWLDRRVGLFGQIEASCRMVVDQQHLCRVFDLAGLREAPV